MLGGCAIGRARQTDFLGGYGAAGRTHKRFAPAPPHHTLARHAPYTQTSRNECRTVRPGRRRASEESAPTLFSGALERFLRSSPQFGVTLAVFELLKEVLLE